MPPAQVNNPRLRTFSLPLGIVNSSTLILTLAFLTHGAPGTLNTAGLNVPLNYGYVRTAIQYVLYTIFPVHIWEASVAYKLASQHRATPLNTLLYTFATFVFGFPVLGEMRRLIQQARVETIKGKKAQ